MRNSHHAARVTRYVVALAAAWTVLLGGSLAWEYSVSRRQAAELGLAKAVTAFEWGRVFRKWVSVQGGVYIPVSAKISPNPLLEQAFERDVATPSGRVLTKINAAYLARLVFESIEEPEAVGRARLVSLKPLNPANAPDPWEANALRAFETGVTEVSEKQTIDGRVYMRLLRSSRTEAPCLECHADQGYEVGDIRGAVGVTVPISDVLESASLQMRGVVSVHGILWLFGLGLIAFGGRQVRGSVRALERSRAELGRKTLLLESEVVERRRLEQARAESETFLKKMIEAEPECVKLLDVDGRLLMMNRRGLDMLDVENEAQVRGQVVYPLICERDRGAFEALTRRVFAGGEGTLVFEAVGVKGRHVWLETHAVPLRDEQGRIVSLLGITRDITEKKHVEDQLAAKVRELERALSQVKLLEGIIPICAGCKKIRDDKDSWQQLETYISEHSEAHFSHGLCPSCLESTMREARGTRAQP